jgi:hypothetical protein
MVSLFYIHSHTTFLSAAATINKINLPLNKIVIITTRNYKISDNVLSTCKIIDLSIDFSFLMDNKYNLFKVLKRTKKVDMLINLEIGGNYKAFLPHIGIYLMQIIASHPFCKEVNFIEEGSACYSKSMQLNNGSFKNNIKILISKFLFPTKRFWLTDLLFEDLYKQFNINSTYAIFLKAFEFLKFEKRIIEWPKYGLNVEIKSEHPIFIFDALIEMNYIEPKMYWSAVKRMVQESSHICNYIKFHPYQKIESKNFIKNQFKLLNVQYIELAQNIIMEDIIINRANLTFIGFSSSILLYAKIYNHNVKTYEQLFQLDKKYAGFRRLYDFEL